MSDNLVCFASGSRQMWRVNLCVLNTDTNKAFALDMCSSINSLTTLTCQYGLLMATAAGNSVRVILAGRAQQGSTVVKTLARSVLDGLDFVNFVRLLDIEGKIVLNVALNSQVGLLQFALRITEKADNGELQIAFEELQEVRQRDYANCYATQEIELEDGSRELVSAVVNDGLMGAVYRNVRETGVLVPDSEERIDWVFHLEGVNPNDRHADQPHYAVINQRGVMAICMERQRNSIVVFPNVLKVNDRSTLPICFSTTENASCVVFSQTGNILAASSREHVWLISTTPSAMEAHATKQIPLPTQRLDQTFDHICGVSFSENRLFVGDSSGIYEFEILGVQTLKSLCIKWFIQDLKNEEGVLSKMENWKERLPTDIVEAVCPSEKQDVEFEGLQITRPQMRAPPVHQEANLYVQFFFLFLSLLISFVVMNY